MTQYQRNPLRKVLVVLVMSFLTLSDCFCQQEELNYTSMELLTSLTDSFPSLKTLKIDVCHDCDFSSDYFLKPITDLELHSIKHINIPKKWNVKTLKIYSSELDSNFCLLHLSPSIKKLMIGSPINQPHFFCHEEGINDSLESIELDGINLKSLDLNYLNQFNALASLRLFDCKITAFSYPIDTLPLSFLYFDNSLLVKQLDLSCFRLYNLKSFVLDEPNLNKLVIENCPSLSQITLMSYPDTIVFGENLISVEKVYIPNPKLIIYNPKTGIKKLEFNYLDFQLANQIFKGTESLRISKLNETIDLSLSKLTYCYIGSSKDEKIYFQTLKSIPKEFRSNVKFNIPNFNKSKTSPLNIERKLARLGFVSLN